MEEKIMSLEEAYKDFMTWAFSDEIRNTFTVDNRHYFHKTAGDIYAGKCGPQRIKNIFRNFAPERYVVSETVVLKTSSAPVCPRCGGLGIDPYPGHSTTQAPCPECETETATD